MNEDPNARLIHDLKAEVDRLRQLLRLQDLDPGNLWAYPAVATHGLRWLGSRVVSVLDSGAEGPGFNWQPRRCRLTVLGKLFTPIVPLFTKQQNWQQPS